MLSFFTNLFNKQDECQRIGLHITLTIVISFTTIAPHTVCLRCTAFASAISLMPSDIVQMSSVKVCQLSHFFTSIAFQTLCTMPCLPEECCLIGPFLVRAQPKICWSSLQKNCSTMFIMICSHHCLHHTKSVLDL